MKEKHSIATVISYCSNDDRLLDLAIEEAHLFSAQLLVVVADHFFNGEPEERSLLEAAYRRHPEVLFVEFAYDPKEPYGLHCPVRPGEAEWGHYWHSSGRYVGYHFVDEEIETILFADVDEVHDGKRVCAWLDHSDYRAYAAIRMASYYYFRSARYRALSWLPSSLFVQKRAIQSEMLLDLWERQGVLEAVEGRKMKQAVGIDGLPLVHHFSWVKTREEMVKKARSWGHSHEKDWAALIEKELAEPFRGRDSFYGLHYEEVEPWRDPLAWTPSPSASGEGNRNCVHVNPRTLFRHALRKSWLS